MKIEEFGWDRIIEKSDHSSERFSKDLYAGLWREVHEDGPALKSCRRMQRKPV